jgi:hypothetical protein
MIHRNVGTPLTFMKCMKVFADDHKIRYSGWWRGMMVQALF